ncbi:MAG: 50S ribosomal protein L4 [Kiritimatiellales bacterium]
MSTLPLKDSKGKKLGEVTLSDRFTVSDKGAQAVHQAVVTYQAHQHQGSASTLGKGAVSGSGKKPWKQKGLGRARAGYKQSPVWRGGAVVFGPHPRKVRKSIPRKVARLAFARAFSEKADAGAITVVNGIMLAAPRTKEMTALLSALDVRGKVLIVLHETDVNVCLAARNLPDAEVACADNVNVYQIIRYPQIVITQAAMEKIEQRLA